MTMIREISGFEGRVWRQNSCANDTINLPCRVRTSQRNLNIKIEDLVTGSREGEREA